MLKNGNFLELFVAIRELLITILSSKGGVIYLCKEQRACTQLIKGLDQIAKDLQQTHELVDDRVHEFFEEEHLPGILDKIELVDQKLLRLKRRNAVFGQKEVQRSLCLRMLVLQASSTLKYVMMGMNLVDILYGKQSSSNYGVDFLTALNQLSFISSKSSVSNQALLCLSYNDAFLPLFLEILTVDTTETAQTRHAELAMTCDILHRSIDFCPL